MEPRHDTRATYWPGLDGVRGLAILTVIAFHARPSALPGGSAGVDVFFVLSGFLITHLLIREWRLDDRISLRRFYLRRALRLLPALVVVLPLAVAAGWFAFPHDRRRLVTGAASALLYVANFRRAHQPEALGIFGPTWSLSMEEQFYLVWPCCLLGLLRSHVRPPVIASLTAVSFVLAVTWHHLAATQFDASVAEVLYRPDLRVDGLLLGVTIGVLHGFGLFEGRVPARLVQPAAGGAVVAIAVFMRWPLVLPTSVQHTLAVAFVALGSGIVVIERVRAPGAVLGRILEWRPLVWLGQLSYVLYLTHVPALKITRGVLDGASPALSTVVALAVAVAVSVAVHELVERPALRRKERYSIEPLPPSEDRSLGRA